MKKKFNVIDCVNYIAKVCNEHNEDFDNLQHQLFYRYMLYKSHNEGEDTLIVTIQSNGKVALDYLYYDLNEDAIQAEKYAITSTREFLTACGWDVDDAIKQFEKYLEKTRKDIFGE